MTSPRFIPRSYSEQPKLFGDTMLMTWRPLPEDASESLLDQAGAAKMQHLAAVKIRDAAIAEHGSVKVYAEMFDMEYGRLTKLLSGTVLMRFEDLARAERNLGLKL